MKTVTVTINFNETDRKSVEVATVMLDFIRYKQAGADRMGPIRGKTIEAFSVIEEK